MGFLKKFINELIPRDSTFGWIIRLAIKAPLCFWVAIFRSFRANLCLTGRFFPLRVRIDVGQKFSVFRHSSANVDLKGKLMVSTWGGLNPVSSLQIGVGASFHLNGDFEIGPGVQINIGPHAELTFGGKRLSSASGVTANTRIMVEKSLVIGFDSIMAWDVCISDSDWHDIKDVDRCRAVNIGNRVWISHGVSVLKGAVIPNGCIVGAKSLVSGKNDFEENSLIAGIPAVTKKTGIVWAR